MSVIRDGFADQAAAQNLAAMGKAKSYRAYRVCVVKQNVVTSAGQVFTQGAITIATPDTFELRGDAHHMAYSRSGATHVALKPSQLTFLTSDERGPR